MVVLGWNFLSLLGRSRFVIKLSNSLRVTLPSARDVNRLPDQHPRNAQNPNQHTHQLHQVLTTVHVFITSWQRLVVTEQHHVDEVNQDGRRTSGGIRLLRLRVEPDPLPEHHEHQIPEEKNQEDDLRQKLQ